MIPVTVISLKDSIERRAAMQHQLDGLGIPFRFFDAIDGRTMSRETMMKATPKSRINYCASLTSGEIGCAMSYLSVIAEIARGKSDFAAVLEDDVILTAQVRTFLAEKHLRALPRFDILQLDGLQEKKVRLALNVGSIHQHQLYALLKTTIAIGAIIYTREAARSLAQTISSLSAPIDTMIFGDQLRFGLRTVEIRPPVVMRNTDFSSTIGARSLPKGMLPKPSRELRRLRNWFRHRTGFAYAWGIACLPRLRLLASEQIISKG